MQHTIHPSDLSNQSQPYQLLNKSCLTGYPTASSEIEHASPQHPSSDGMEHVPAAEAEHKASSSEVEPAASLEVNSARLKRRGNGARPHPPSKAEHASGYVGGTCPGRNGKCLIRSSRKRHAAQFLLLNFGYFDSPGHLQIWMFSLFTIWFFRAIHAWLLDGMPFRTYSRAWLVVSCRIGSDWGILRSEYRAGRGQVNWTRFNQRNGWNGITWNARNLRFGSRKMLVQYPTWITYASDSPQTKVRFIKTCIS